MTDNQVFRILWLGVGCTFPLFAVDFLRYDNDQLRIHVAIPTAAMAIIAGLTVFASLMGNPRIGRQACLRRNELLVVGIGILFFFWHIFRLIPAIDSTVATREVAKVGLGVIYVLVVLITFPRDEEFLAKFWWITVWASACLLAFLIYQYAYVFRAAYLGTYLSEQSRSGKNQLGQFLVYVFPYAVTCLWSARRWVYPAIAALILAAGLIYSGSRGAWMAIFVGLLSLVPVVRKGRQSRGLPKFILVIVVIVVASVAALQEYVPVEELEFWRRLEYLYEPSSVPEYESYEVRWNVTKQAISVFLEAPLIGAGLTNIMYILDLLPHNDFLLILSELGIVGAIIFTAMVGIIVLDVKWGRWHNGAGGKMSWVALGSRGALISVLTFELTMDRIYTTPLFWIFLGLVLVAVDTERRKGMSRERVEIGIRR